MGEVIKFIIGLVCIFIIAGMFSLYEYTKKLKYIKKNIVEKYGKEIDLDDVMIKMDSVSSYFRNSDNKNSHYIDDITWNDLNLDDVFKKINNTQSTAGEEILYDILRNPIFDDNSLKKTDNLIEYFSKNEKERKDIQYILGKLGKSRLPYISNCLYNEDDFSDNKLLKYRILSFIPVLSIILMFISKYFLILLVLSILTNIYISQTNKNKNYNADGFSYIISTVRSAEKIKDMELYYINDNLHDINTSIKNVQSIKKKSIRTSSDSIISEIDIISEYTNIISLNELINYEKVKNTLIKYKEDFKNIYEYVGKIDALIGVASYRESLDYYTKPVFTKSRDKKDNYLEFVDIYHPLIKNPVANSASFNKGVLLTGSNASGKSTFIKSIAINAILSQTIYTSLAREYNSSYFNIYTSMALKDDIFSNESYYIVEIKSLKRILDNINDQVPCLCFVDEILRGTNTVERIAASSEVLSFLSSSNCICISATHDIELTSILEDKFDNYHFEEVITDTDVKFDYKLYDGKSKTRNAIKLLGLMGYSDNIVINAENRAKDFLESSVWN